MNKIIILGFVIAAALIIALMMWPSAPSVKAAQGTPVTSQPTSTTTAATSSAKPFATRDEFYGEWQNYLSSKPADQARIRATADAHRDWLDLIFPEKFADFTDGYRLSAGIYRILYPYLSPKIITEYSLLSTSVLMGHKDEIDDLIKAGANVNGENIITAANSVEIIDLLIKNGANPNQPDAAGVLPLDRFKKEGRPDLIQAMIRNGARDSK